ncbi:peroxide stress protein YaaA [Hyphobacterium sp. CCMP332]|nr:peroxide stress protein YaaA [Hyphobacterium sp. CCMP332]
MISVISPAKTLDFESQTSTKEYTKPDFVDESGKIMARLKKTSKKKIGLLMDISKSLVELNYERYQDWEPEFDTGTSKQALMAFKGDVYLGLEAETLNPEDLSFAQNHLRILSGLHGLLKPLDLIRPYRLEMGTDLKVGRRNNLYEFWKDKLYKKLNEAIENSGSLELLNIASNEYFNAVDSKKIKAKIVKADFKDFKNGEYKVLSFFAKKTRGQMARYIIDNKINTIEDIKSFDRDGYYYSEKESSENKIVFLRD